MYGIAPGGHNLAPQPTGIAITRRRGTHLLHFGTSLDVAGTRFRALYSDAMEEVVSRHPRTGLADHLWEVWEEESERRHPGCRAQFLNRFFLRRLICKSPFDDMSKVCDDPKSGKPR